jgi:hypothetical protein
MVYVRTMVIAVLNRKAGTLRKSREGLAVGRVSTGTNTTVKP